VVAAWTYDKLKKEFDALKRHTQEIGNDLDVFLKKVITQIDDHTTKSTQDEEDITSLNKKFQLASEEHVKSSKEMTQQHEQKMEDLVKQMQE
jgi:hypothetical protein